MAIKSITLTSALKFGDQTITQLDIRAAKARDFRNLKSLDKPFAMMLDLAAELTGLPGDVLDELESADFSQLMEVMSGFLAGFQATGKMSSAT